MKIPYNHTEIIEILMEKIKDLEEYEEIAMKTIINNGGDKYKEGYSRGCSVTLELIRTIVFDLTMSYMNNKYR